MSDGIAEELLNLLAKVPDLKVIARTSSFAFKGQNVEIAEIARRLNVAHGCGKIKFASPCGAIQRAGCGRFRRAFLQRGNRGRRSTSS